MVTVTEFIVMLLTSIVELIQTFLFDVLLANPDPLQLLSFLAGAVFVTLPSIALVYLVLGAIGELFSGVIDLPAGGPPQQE